MNMKAKNELIDILSDLDDLGRRAQDIIKQHFPQQRGRMEAYQTCTWGRSGNPYDTTLEKLIEEIEQRGDEE